MKVYVLTDGYYIKIGVTSTLISKRIKQLQTGNPNTIYSIGFKECENKDEAYNLEGRLHKLFKGVKIINEWFQPDIYSIISLYEELTKFEYRIPDKLNDYILTNKLMGEVLPIIDKPMFMGPLDLYITNYIKEYRTITLYRGTSIEEGENILYDLFINSQSWTLDKEVAEFFAYRHYPNSKDRCVVEVEINTEDVLTFISDRQEYEVIIKQNIMAETAKLL